MPDAPGTDEFKVFRVEDRGDALVVRPQGDAPGFSHVDVVRERTHVGELVADAKYRTLVVDLGDANYLGSEMIGYLNGLVTNVRETGREHVVVNASPDMRSGLAITRLDQHWNLVDDPQAIHRFAPGSLSDRVRQNAAVLVACLVAAVGVAIAAFVLFAPDDGDVKTYAELAEVWAEYKSLPRQDPHDVRWRGFSRRARERLDPLIAELEQTSSSRHPARQRMLHASRDYLYDLVDRNRTEPDAVKVQQFLRAMREARAALPQRPGKPLPLLTARGLEQPKEDDEPGDPSEEEEPHREGEANEPMEE